jgi:DNA-binding NarL/FixJ family response regulator
MNTAGAQRASRGQQGSAAHTAGAQRASRGQQGTAAIRVALADDHEVFVEGLRMVLSVEDDLEVVATAPDGRSALRMLDEHKPDVLVLDVHMPSTDIEQVVATARRSAPATRLLMLSADTRPKLVTNLLKAGAHGFVAKDASARQLAGIIRRLAEGQDGPVSCPSPTEPGDETDRQVRLLVNSLSPREQQILALLTAGWSNRRIAQECFLSVNTVRTHVQNVLVKLGVHSKLEAAAFAVRHGVVQPGVAVSTDVPSSIPS